MNNIGTATECTNCKACVQICPKQCITLERVGGIERKPVVDNKKCIDCGLCLEVCHLNKKEQHSKDKNPIAYACVNNDSQEIATSTSGGAFGAIAKYVLTQNGIVYGCAYQNHLQVKHIRIDNILDLHLLRGSKYVQSEIGDTYKQAQKDLKDGRLVLYSGTPCQIAGLKGFLRKEYVNLITIDLICHGVPPVEFFDKFVSWYEKKHNVVLDKVAFRDKGNGGWRLSGYLYGDKNGKKIKKKLYAFSNWYYFYFLKGKIYTKSCYECKYANLDRQGDFTLGDCWGSEKFDLPFKAFKGCSLVLLNTAQAQEIFSKLPLTSHSIPLEKACQFNGQLVSPTKKPADYNELINEIKNSDAEEIQNKFKKRYKKAIIFGKLKNLMPKSLIRLIKKLK